MTETETENTETPPHPEDKSNNALLAAVTNLNAYLTTLHAALPPHTALLLFSGHSDPCSMSTLAAGRAEYQTGPQQQGTKVTAVLERRRRVGCVGARRMIGRSRRRSSGQGWGLLFVGVKT